MKSTLDLVSYNISYIISYICDCEYSEEKENYWEGAFSATLSSNVFSQSRLASNQRLMNQIGNLVTLQVGENQNWIKLGQENTQTQES